MIIHDLKVVAIIIAPLFRDKKLKNQNTVTLVSVTALKQSAHSK